MRAARLRSFVALARSAGGFAAVATVGDGPSDVRELKSRAMRTSRMVTPVSSKRWCMVGWVMTAHRALRRRTPARICAMSWPSALRIWGWPAKYSRVGGGGGGSASAACGSRVPSTKGSRRGVRPRGERAEARARGADRESSDPRHDNPSPSANAHARGGGGGPARGGRRVSIHPRSFGRAGSLATTTT